MFEPFSQKRTSWNPKHPFINGCFNWMIPNLYIENGCFMKHPLLLQCYSVLQSTNPVLLCTTKYYAYYSVLHQYHSVLPSTTTYYASTTTYYASTTVYYKVLLQYYSVLHSTTPVLQRTTPVLQCTTQY